MKPGYKLAPGLVSALLSGGLCAVMLAAGRALTTGGGEGGLVGIPLGLMTVVVAIVLALVSWGVFLSKRWVLAGSILVMPVIWAVDFAYFVHLPGIIEAVAGWGVALALAGFYIWQLRSGRPVQPAQPLRLDPAVVLAVVLAFPVIGTLLGLTAMAIMGFSQISGPSVWVLAGLAMGAVLLLVVLLVGVHRRGAGALRMAAGVFPLLWVVDCWVIVIHNLQEPALIAALVVAAGLAVVWGRYYLRLRRV